MKKNSPELQNKNNDNEVTPERRSRVKEALALLAVAAVTSGVTAFTVDSIFNKSPDGREKPVSAAEASTQHKEALRKELEAAYFDTNGDGILNDISIARAEISDDTIQDGSVKRGVIKIHINGSAKNYKVADSKGTPTYSYGLRSGINAPVNTVVAVNGKDAYPEPALSSWESDQATGEALLYPRLDRFAGSQPTILDYKIQLGAHGRLLNDGTLEALYEAGDVVVTGSNGTITGVDIVPRDKDTPPLRITEEE